MKLIRNKYKIDKIQTIFQKKVLHIFQMGNLSSKKTAEIRDRLIKSEIEMSKINNTLVRTFSKNTGYKNINAFIQGPLFIGYTNKEIEFNGLNKLVKMTESLTHLCSTSSLDLYSQKELESVFKNSNPLLTKLTLINTLQLNSNAVLRCIDLVEKKKSKAVPNHT